MLFNSYVFLFAFLPAVLAGFVLAGRAGAAAGAAWLALASLVFYTWWNWHFTLLLCGSILFNFLFGNALLWRVARRRPTGPLLALGVTVDLGVLGYFKYANFFAANLGDLLHMPIDLATIVLPIGISFFTFTQIAYLVDVSQGRVRESSFIHYVLFVTYFPHLIAGPILHHAEMIPQFRRPETYVLRAKPFAVGLTVFILGLFKKVVLADSVAAYADPLFASAASHPPTLLAAWSGALAYSLQIYFDFSAYCDMAIGLSRMLNIRLPANFESPYKARSIIDFWRRWHMTLSRFLRDYLYIPLGGNRHGSVRRYVNLLATMILGGLWHGAGWPFIVWGALHGSYLAINHAWRLVRRRLSLPDGGLAGELAAWAVTFVSVVVAWVFFRATDIATAGAIIRAMAGLNELSGAGLQDAGGAVGLAWIGGLLAVALLAPNLREIFRRYRIVLDFDARLEPPLRLLPVAWLRWSPTVVWGTVAFASFVVALMHMTRVSQFLYFQF